MFKCAESLSTMSLVSENLWTKLRWMSSISCMTCFRKSTMSLTVAWLVPRNCKMSSTKSEKSISCALEKRKSEYSTRPTTSTPTCCMNWAASGKISSSSNSVRDKHPFPSTSSWRTSIICNILALTMFTMSVSFSIVETVDTDSTKTPTSMFMMVSVAIKMKRTRSRPSPTFWSPSANTISAMSGNVPWRKSETIEPWTEAKYRSPTGVPSVICLNVIPNTKIVKHRRTRVKNTDLEAIHNPRRMMRSSGM
mmetsp:Transcript_51408/g.159400  ORF Transcript_51408/g.159400 Transcript_51408/m.159400 type:complete len:251 (-) Transcript_51408:1654-2406(-)